MKDAVGPQLQDQQAGFGRGTSCTDQIATLFIALKQYSEWKPPFCVNSLDHEKAFDSLDLLSLRELIRRDGVPEKITNIIRNSYSGMTYRVVCGRQLTDAFQVNTGVRQACLLLPCLFLLAIHWMWKTSIAQRVNGSQWTP